MPKVISNNPPYLPDEMDLREFVSEGYLLEANRLIFHPWGLCLTVEEWANGKVELAVLDYRDEEDGCVYDEFTNEDILKSIHVLKETRERVERRIETLGFVAQPVTNKNVPQFAPGAK